jgi:23S rRNA (guanosine2251-2'-O)-methyltransferase
MAVKGRVVFGIHAAESAVSQSPEKVVSIWLDNGRKDRRLNELRQLCGKMGVVTQNSDRKQLDKMANSQNHQGVVMEMLLPEEMNEESLQAAVKKSEGSAFFLVLDRVQDPHNLGACLRTADATGVQGIIVPKDQAVHLTPTVCKVASGAAETVPLYRVTNLTRTLKWMKSEGVWLVGADGDSDSTIYDIDLRDSIAIVVGAESEGMRRLTKETCDFIASLPMKGQVESLNLSAATAVFLYEAVRQRGL